MTLEEFDEVLVRVYLPGIEVMLQEHEQWCREHPEVAAFLASLPNGGWRKVVLAGEDE